MFALLLTLVISFGDDCRCNPCLCDGCACGSRCDDSYAEALAKAKASGKPLVVGVCCRPPKGDWIGCRVASFPWEGPMPRLVLSNAKGEWVCDLPAHSSPADVAEALSRPVPLFAPPSRPAIPSTTVAVRPVAVRVSSPVCTH